MKAERRKNNSSTDIVNKDEDNPSGVEGNLRGGDQKMDSSECANKDNDKKVEEVIESGQSTVQEKKQSDGDIASAGDDNEHGRSNTAGTQKAPQKDSNESEAQNVEDGSSKKESQDVDSLQATKKDTNDTIALGSAPDGSSETKSTGGIGADNKKDDADTQEAEDEKINVISGGAVAGGSIEKQSDDVDIKSDEEKDEEKKRQIKEGFETKKNIYDNWTIYYENLDNMVRHFHNEELAKKKGFVSFAKTISKIAMCERGSEKERKVMSEVTKWQLVTTVNVDGNAVSDGMTVLSEDLLESIEEVNEMGKTERELRRSTGLAANQKLVLYLKDDNKGIWYAYLSLRHSQVYKGGIGLYAERVFHPKQVIGIYTGEVILSDDIGGLTDGSVRLWDLRYTRYLKRKYPNDEAAREKEKSDKECYQVPVLNADAKWELLSPHGLKLSSVKPLPGSDEAAVFDPLNIMKSEAGKKEAIQLGMGLHFTNDFRRTVREDSDILKKKEVNNAELIEDGSMYARKRINKDEEIFMPYKVDDVDDDVESNDDKSKEAMADWRAGRASTKGTSRESSEESDSGESDSQSVAKPSVSSKVVPKKVTVPKAKKAVPLQHKSGAGASAAGKAKKLQSQKSPQVAKAQLKSSASTAGKAKKGQQSNFKQGGKALSAKKAPASKKLVGKGKTVTAKKSVVGDRGKKRKADSDSDSDSDSSLLSSDSDDSDSTDSTDSEERRKRKKQKRKREKKRKAKKKKRRKEKEEKSRKRKKNEEDDEDYEERE